MSELDRRDFITAGAAVAGGLAFAGGLYAQGQQSINVGIIGCGGRGSGALRNILDADKEVKIAAICDLNEGKAKGTLANLKKRNPNQTTATDDKVFHGLDGYKELLALPDVNYVILATPPGFRPYHLEVAGTQRRHQAGYIETIKQIKDGAIGDITSLRCAWNNEGIWFHPRNKGESDLAYQIRNWYHFLWLCGDHIVEQHVHNLDVANWAMKATPVKVNGMGGRSNRPVGDPNEVGQIFDHFALEYEYPNGVVVQSYCRQIEGCVNNVSEDFVGTKARVHTHPGNYFANSVSSYNRLYNLFWFNNGYHQEHHWDPKTHWTMMDRLRQQIKKQSAS